jgi:hypothetical protein
MAENENENERGEQRPTREVKLTPFWPTNPAAWFRAAEGKFFLRGIDDELARFYNCLHALPESTITLISDLVEADPPPATPYQALKARLLTAYQLTNIQRVEQLFNMPPLGGQRPSELLAEMIRLCPRGQENNDLFNYLFLNKLPRELRVLLSEADMADKQALAARADSFAAHHQRLAHDTVAAVASEPVEGVAEEDWVAVVRPSNSSRGSGTRPQHGGGSSRGGGGGSGKKKSYRSKPDWSAGLCEKHRIYGADARTCQAPCTWAGN